MKYSSIKNLSDIRKEIWSIQEEIEKEKGKGNPVGDIYKNLGMLSNKIMRYMYADLADSNSVKQLIQKLSDNKRHVPIFSSILINVEALRDNTEPINETDEDSYNQRMKEMAQDLIEKVTQKK